MTTDGRSTGAAARFDAPTRATARGVRSAERSVPVDRGAVAQLLVIGVLTVAAYVALSFVEQSLSSNGYSAAHPFLFPRHGVDFQRAQQDSTLLQVLAVVLTALFVWLVLASRRWTSPLLRLGALLIPVVVAIQQFVVRPLMSIDVYSYLGQGRIASSGGNPYAIAVSTLGRTGYGHRLGEFGWLPVHPQTPYGPIWTAVESAVVGLTGDDVAAGASLLKLVVVAALGGTAALIWVLLGSLDRPRRLTGTLLFLANPLVLVEFAGEGHVDAVMVFFVVLSAWGCVRRSPVVAVVALGAAVLVKPTAVVFALPIAASLLARRHSTRRLVVAGGGAVAGTALAAALLYAPYWIGPRTFQGLSAAGALNPSWSVAGVLVGVLPRGVVAVVLAAVTVIAALALSLAARTLTGLIAACAAVGMLAFLLLPLYWPWYGVLPLPFLALLPSAIDIGVAALLALGSRLAAPAGIMNILGVPGFGSEQHRATLVGLTIPALLGLPVLVLQVVRSVRRGGRGDALDHRPAAAELVAREADGGEQADGHARAL